MRLSGRGTDGRHEADVTKPNRLNTILKAQAFMDLSANATLGDGGETALTTDCGSGQSGRRPHCEVFQAERLRDEGDKLDAGKTVWFPWKMVVVHRAQWRA